jgi:hypothetical protein
MKDFTAIAVRHSDADCFRGLAKSLRIPHHRLFGGLVRYFGQLTREQQELELGLADPASPSSGDASQSDSRTVQKQRPAGATLSRRRGAA